MFVYLLSKLCDKSFKNFLVAIQSFERNLSATFNFINSDLEPNSRDIRLAGVFADVVLLLDVSLFVHGKTI
jgi:hypothetical protein